ncbi:hypothetical protein AKJ09_06053 [Labilithrix luteola]|uniref:Uncharacterized protein n=1 Tax=Labilithrix luteola TaxID=1391654 RepID=A0A0K1Q1Y7_9BACT|nr:hypothetical protein AKJ09_06053 [Labilithrix luteola]
MALASPTLPGTSVSLDSCVGSPSGPYRHLAKHVGSVPGASEAR